MHNHYYVWMIVNDVEVVIKRGLTYDQALEIVNNAKVELFINSTL